MTTSLRSLTLSHISGKRANQVTAAILYVHAQAPNTTSINRKIPRAYGSARGLPPVGGYHRSKKNKIVSGAPIIINGRLRPNLVRIRSDRDPISGALIAFKTPKEIANAKAANHGLRKTTLIRK
jgi:hypothetical protein